MRAIFILIFICFAACLQAQLVKVVGMADGDSFTVLFPDKHTQRVRLYGIDCPEYEQPFSQIAKQFTVNLIYRKDVLLHQTDTDRYGRIVALVYLPNDTVSVNEKLLQAGLAWHYARYDNNPRWAQLQQQAIQSKKGIWSGSEIPVPPWEWRSRKTF